MTTPPTDNLIDNDPWLWLEDVDSEAALGWVRERNAETRAVLEAHPRFTRFRADVLQVLNARDRIPQITRRGDWLYNLWQDDEHQRGLWRRTTLADYRNAEPQWEVVLDLDALAIAEQENWVWAGADGFGPDHERCLVSLSRGGADAQVTREFDTVARRFVDDGFVLPEAKSSVEWIDIDTVYVATDFGPGSLTDSGYPRVVKRWRRGQPLAEAVTVFEGETADVSVGVSVDRTPGFERTVFARSTDFYNSLEFLLADDGRLLPIAKPDDASVSFWNEHLLVELRSDLASDGQVFPQGSLLVTRAEHATRAERSHRALFTPTATRSLAGFTATRSTLILDLLDTVASRLEEWRPSPDGQWQSRSVAAPFPGTLSVGALHDPLLADDPLAEAYLLSYTDFLTPDSLALGQAGSDVRELLKSRPAQFDATGMRVEQCFARSKDGTEVPYFVVWPREPRNDGRHPTLLYGYGGFEVSLQPWYSGSFGRAWFEMGGVLVVANIRGGGEFGPGWHQAAVKEHKQASYDDFIAVAEDLIARGITTPEHLGIQGGSNGGLLVGAVFVQRPELFNAVVCQVPLLDMRRYHRLLAGASWMAEYGDPDDAGDWDVIARYSPYHNVQPGVRYPKVLFTTSTRDDRVHPAHARKMAARMREQGHALLYYENIEGGHGGAADNLQRADLMALEFAYLWQQLGT